jgi:hypothetical protein
MGDPTGEEYAPDNALNTGNTIHTLAPCNAYFTCHEIVISKLILSMVIKLFLNAARNNSSFITSNGLDFGQVVR